MSHSLHSYSILRQAVSYVSLFLFALFCVADDSRRFFVCRLITEKRVLISRTRSCIVIDLSGVDVRPTTFAEPIIVFGKQQMICSFGVTRDRSSRDLSQKIVRWLAMDMTNLNE